MSKGRQNSVHVTGVAGVGMSALAQVLTWSHHLVTGSDRYRDQGVDLPVLHALEQSGVTLVPQDGSAVNASTAAVVYSTAIERGNPDFMAAEKYGVPCVHRAKMLAEEAAGHPVWAVAGTAGKTTTTGMLGWILEQIGLNPTVVNGGALVDWAGEGSVGNVRRGAPDSPWVLEVDESDRSLLEFHPEWSILTNISQDHFSLVEVRKLFRRYAEQVHTGVICGPGVAEVLGPLRALRIEPEFKLESGADGGAWLRWRGTRLRVRLPGRHNLLNGLLAAELCAQLGGNPMDIAEALGRFNGIQRRLERVDRGGAVSIFDDYAHNPIKIAAAWNAASDCAKGRRILGVWRPHGFKPLRDMLSPLADALTAVMRPSDRLWLLPVYYAGGTVDAASVSSDDLARQLQMRGVNVGVVADYSALAGILLREAHAGDTILLMGARDPALPDFARRLADSLHS